MSKTTFIYALCDPHTREVRYIGKANKPECRLRGHIHGATKKSSKNTHKNAWIKKVLSGSSKPYLKILDEVPIEHWQQWEVAWIEFYKERGGKLVNTTEGGEGPVFLGEKNPFFGKTHTLETKEKVAASNRRRIYSPEFRAKIAAITTGRKHTEATRKKLSEKLSGSNNPMFGKVQTLEHRRKNSAANVGAKNHFFGKKHSPESRMKISNSRRKGQEKKRLDESIYWCMVSV